MLQARVDKENENPKLLNRRCRLVVMVLETGGRLSNDTVDFIWQLAQPKVQEVPSFMTHQMAFVWERRWTRMLSTMCALSFAELSVEPSHADVCITEGHMSEVPHDPRLFWTVTDHISLPSLSKNRKMSHEAHVTTIRHHV